MRRNTERMAWFNGKLMPESKVSISLRDQASRSKYGAR